MTTDTRLFKRTALIFVLTLGVAIGLLTTPGHASDTPPDSLQRKVKVMQRVIDEILIQSDHVVVSPGGVTRGLVLDGYGVLFTFDASVGENLLFGQWFVPDVRVDFDEDLDLRSGTRVPAPDPSPDLVEWQSKKKEAEEKQQQDREALRGELVDALLDYGVTLNELGDDSWVVIAAFLGGSGPFGGSNDDDRLVIRVRMRDLRGFMTGSLSREEARAAVVVEG